MKLIICGLKVLGKSHIEGQINAIKNANKVSNLITGFDLVNEEDATPPILDFVKQITDADGEF